MILDLCQKCSFIQSRYITNPKHRYASVDYSYTSSNSNYSKNHWINFANFLSNKVKLKNKKIIDKVTKLKLQGIAQKNKSYWHDVIGYNYKMTNICASIGVGTVTI